MEHCKLLKVFQNMRLNGTKLSESVTDIKEFIDSQH